MEEILEEETKIMNSIAIFHLKVNTFIANIFKSAWLDAKFNDYNLDELYFHCSYDDDEESTTITIGSETTLFLVYVFDGYFNGSGFSEIKSGLSNINIYTRTTSGLSEDELHKVKIIGSLFKEYTEKIINKHLLLE